MSKSKPVSVGGIIVGAVVLAVVVAAGVAMSINYYAQYS